MSMIGRTHAPTLLVLLLATAGWAYLSTRMSAYILPSPVSVLIGFGGIVATGQIWQHVGASLFRIGLGFAAAVALSLVVGLLTARARVLRQVAADLTAILNSTSVFVWIVLAMIWFGLTNTAPIFTTCMIVLPVMLSTVLEGIDAVDRALVEMARVYRLSELDCFLHVIVPSMLPYIIAGMKVGFALGLRVSVMAEIFGVGTGIGYMMNFSRDTLRTDLVFVWATVLIAVMVIAEKTVFDALSRRLTTWR
jgi:NitT/TauT family transport system permease protein